MPQMNEDENFKERSEITQQIITQKSDFVEKWALLIFVLLIACVLIISSFIQYPDVIQANATLSGNNTPKDIIPNSSGKLISLFVKNNHQVKEGEIIGWLESNADINTINELTTALISSKSLLEKDSSAEIIKLFENKFNKLGELQGDYQNFYTTLEAYNDYLENGFYYKKRGVLKNDILSILDIKNNIISQKSLNDKDLSLVKESYDMNESLFKNGVLSAEEYRQSKRQLLSKELVIPQIDINILLQQNQIIEKQKEIDQLNHDFEKERLAFYKALSILKENTEAWLTKFTIRAPTEGKIVFAMPVQENQYIYSGKTIGFVNPKNSDFYAEIKIAQRNFGKIDTGMKVQLRFDAYPYQEIGHVHSTLNYISDITVDSLFLGTAIIGNKIITSQNKQIQYKNGLRAEALIITKETSLIKKLYYSITKSMFD